MKIGKVLSLSGGGSWGSIEARTLMQLYPNMTGTQILDQFDIAIANSAGSIVLAALAADMTPKQIYDIFCSQDSLHKIYTKVGGMGSLVSQLGVGARWSSAAKLAEISSVLGDAGRLPMTQLKGRIAICAYDLDRNLETIFRSYASPLESMSTVFMPTLAEAAHASSSAPVVYFDNPAVITSQDDPTDTRRFWDGGLGSYNLPARAGLTEAHALGFDTVYVISLATGLTWRPLGGKGPIYDTPGDADLVGTIKCLARDCITAPAVSALAATVMCPNVSLVHLSPYIKPDGVPGAWTSPAGLTKALGPTAFARLVGFDMDLTAPQDIQLLCDMTEAWIAGSIDNEPIIRDPLTGQAVLGVKTFAEAAQQWRELIG